MYVQSSWNSLPVATPYFRLRFTVLHFLYDTFIFLCCITAISLFLCVFIKIKHNCRNRGKMHVYVCIIASFQPLLKYRLYTHICLERNVSFPRRKEDGKVEPTQPLGHSNTSVTNQPYMRCQAHRILWHRHTLKTHLEHESHAKPCWTQKLHIWNWPCGFLGHTGLKVHLHCVCCLNVSWSHT